MPFDNGLTPEQQADVDAKYEELMAQVKKIDLKLRLFVNHVKDIFKFQYFVIY